MTWKKNVRFAYNSIILRKKAHRPHERVGVGHCFWPHILTARRFFFMDECVCVCKCVFGTSYVSLYLVWRQTGGKGEAVHNRNRQYYRWQSQSYINGITDSSSDGILNDWVDISKQNHCVRLRLGLVGLIPPHKTYTRMHMHCERVWNCPISKSTHKHTPWAHRKKPNNNTKTNNNNNKDIRN